MAMRVSSPCTFSRTTIAAHRRFASRRWRGQAAGWRFLQPAPTENERHRNCSDETPRAGAGESRRRQPGPPDKLGATEARDPDAKTRSANRSQCGDAAGVGRIWGRGGRVSAEQVGTGRQWRAGRVAHPEIRRGGLAACVAETSGNPVRLLRPCIRWHNVFEKTCRFSAELVPMVCELWFSQYTKAVGEGAGVSLFVYWRRR